MTPEDFRKYKAIVVPDPRCGNLSFVQFLEETKKNWSPAIQGNIILIGTDPTYHVPTQTGAVSLIHDSVSFAAAGNGTGLYYSLSCYYDKIQEGVVSTLSEFGRFAIRGRLSCYNDAHLVSTSSALSTLTDEALSNWRCSVHEVFAEYPTTGINGFEPLAIARNANGTGQKNFADNSTGIPYIISRGATPLGCGNGFLDVAFDEECDYGPQNGMPGSLCTKSCKCVFGALSPGICAPNITTSSTTSSASSTPFLNR